ncbi:unnamed protein product [Larinioides sclopetarius]|uniref:Uncharacterized protein n=1 Tax=Larinioides sclopetarius TaxID=280406 RepID=A0AAV1YQP6_9ARAC
MCGVGNVDGTGYVWCGECGWYGLCVVWGMWMVRVMCGVGNVDGTGYVWCGDCGWYGLCVVWGLWMVRVMCGVGTVDGTGYVWCGDCGWYGLCVVWGLWMVRVMCGVGNVDGKGNILKYERQRQPSLFHIHLSPPPTLDEQKKMQTCQPFKNLVVLGDTRLSRSWIF